MRRSPATVLGSYLEAPLTYPEVGATKTASMPPGYRILEQADTIGHGEASFGRLAAALTRWDLQRAIGLEVAASAPTAVPGATIVSALPLGPLRLAVPCRVVFRVEDGRAVGFGYGSLPGHPLVGEERFTAELDQDGRVTLRIASFSRPAGVARIGGPLTRAGQAAINRRYAAAAPALADGARGGR